MGKRLFIEFGRGGYGYLMAAGSRLQSVFLLLVRFYWGWQFFRTGKGKLTHIDKVVGFFHELGIPFASLNAHLVGATECVGGICLLLGFASRLMAIPLIFITVMAYLTAQREALQGIFSDPDKFTSADPFLFMLAAVIVFLFGPGTISVDGLLKWYFGRQKTKTLHSQNNALS